MLSALSFLTVVGGSRVPDAKTLRWFPIVGAAIGAALAVLWVGAVEIWPPAVAALVVVVADLVLTGMLHLDGLADSADGLLPHLDRVRRLEVMRSPDVGAFAVGVVATVLLARWVALAGDLIDPLALVGIWMASRTLMSVVPAVVDYARSAGLASPFLAGARRWFALWLAPAAVILMAAQQGRGLVALGVGVAAGCAVVLLATRRLGGFTGDVLGAAAMMIETVALLVLTTR